MHELSVFPMMVDSTTGPVSFGLLNSHHFCFACLRKFAEHKLSGHVMDLLIVA